MNGPAGPRLKKIRLEKGFTIEEVCNKTKIHLNVLKAIEEDQHINLSPVYIKGFLKIYCKFLGLDPRDFVHDYKESGTVKIATLQQKGSFSILKSNLQKIFSLRPKHINLKLISRIALAIIFIFVLFNFGRFFNSKHKQRTVRKTRPPVLSSPKKEEKKIQEKSQKSAAPIAVKQAINTEKITLAEAASGISLSINARENCLIQLKADGKVLFHGTLGKGRAENWKAKDKIELSLGNAGGVDLEINGKLIPSLGRKGQSVKNIIITKNGLTVGK